MMKFKRGMLLISILAVFQSVAQVKTEREHRIRKKQFPAIEMSVLKDAAKGSSLKRVRYYRAIDSVTTDYILKFKIQRLHYQAHYHDDGRLNKIGFGVGQMDFPSDVYHEIISVLDAHFQKYKIRKMFQEYTVRDNYRETVKNAFQNLLLPTNQYRFIIRGRFKGGSNDYEVSFDAQGDLIELRKALPANYERTLF